MQRKKYVLLSLMVCAILLVGCTSPQAFSPAKEIHVISREDGSGTRGAFTELTGISEKNEAGETYDFTTKEAVITNSTSVVMLSVGEDSHAIGYLSLGSLDDSVKRLSVEGIAPTAEHIKDGSYPIARPFLLATPPDISPVTQDFLRFIVSKEGQEIVEKNGYVAITEGEPYKDTYLSGKIVVGGSSSVTPVIEKLREAYLFYHPDVVIEVQQSDSTTGMASVVTGNYDIGMSSRSLKDSEKAEGLVEYTVAMDGIVMIVNHNNTLSDISLADIRNIFTGEKTHWQEVGGIAQ